MVYYPVGISSLAVSFPKIIRTNDYWQENFPELIPQTHSKRVKRSPRFTKSTYELNELDIWSQEVAPYLSDPFRGSVERRVLGNDESSLTLEYCAAKDALDAAQLSPDRLDLIIVSSLFSERVVSGNAVDLAQKLDLSIPAWNLESTCSSALIALQNACALIQTGEYSRVLVVTSHIGSNSVDERDTLSWSMGDGAGAFVVEALKPDQGILGSKIVNTASTCGAYSQETIIDKRGKRRIRTRTGDNVSMLATTAVDYVSTCCKEAATAAGVTLEQINFFVFNTPTAWYANVCTKALGIESERAINLYPRYANIGSVYPIANLYHAALSDKIREDDLVLVYSNGAGATAAATVVRWGNVALGSNPAPPISLSENTALPGRATSSRTQRTQEQEKIETKKTKNFSQATSLSGTKINFSREQILAVEPEQRRQVLENYLSQVLSNLLELSNIKLDSQQSFSYLIDSLMALEMKRRIEFDLQMQVPMAKFFQDDSIEQVVDFLLSQLVISELTTPSLPFFEQGENWQEILL